MGLLPGKGIKSAVTLGSINAWQAAGKTAPSQLTQESARYIAQQDSIALGAIGALTRYRLVWYGSVGLGVVAAVLLAIPVLRR